jgi:chemotaxis protein histidine kinase CheA
MGKGAMRYEGLVEAAGAFVEELRSYALLSEAFQRAPLVSSKHLERVNDTLGRIAEAEQRLAACGQRLAQAVAEAHADQERLAQATLARIPAIKERTTQLGELLARFEALGQEAARLNQGEAAPGTAAAGDENARARALLTQLRSLAERAHELTMQARQAEFDELSNRCHALYQQLASAQKKLELATLG